MRSPDDATRPTSAVRAARTDGQQRLRSAFVVSIVSALAALVAGRARAGQGRGPRLPGVRHARRDAGRLAAAEGHRGRPLRRGAAARHRHRPHGERADRARARHPDLPEPDRRLGRGGLRLSAARRRRRRHAEDGDRRPHRRSARSRRSRRRAQVYEQAKAAGHKATLLEQERPNIFTNSVANIGPGETVLVQIEYQEPVRQSGDMFSLRVPLVVAPRYNPTPVVQTVDFAAATGQGWGTRRPIRCRTATASRRRCSTRASTRRSIR